MRKKICIALIVAFTVLLGVSSYFIIDYDREAEHQEQMYDFLVQIVEDLSLIHIFVIYLSCTIAFAPVAFSKRILLYSSRYSSSLSPFIGIRMLFSTTAA